MMQKFNIANHIIGGKNPCFVIAEIGSNHNNNYDQAIELIDAAAEAGVDAVKFQTFRAASHYSKKAPSFDYLEDVETYDLIHSLEINRDWHQPLKKYSESIGLVFLSSPCDINAIVELDQLGMEAFKLASFDLPDLTLVKKMAETGKPLIFSTGMANWMDIQRAVDMAHAMGNEKILIPMEDGSTSTVEIATDVAGANAAALEEAKLITADMKNQDVKDMVNAGKIPEIVALIAYLNSLK